MATEAQPQLAGVAHEDGSWSAPKRLALYFCLIYFGLYCICTQILPNMLPLPDLEIPELAGTPPVTGAVNWTAQHVLRAKMPLVTQTTGSGDRTFDWTLCFCALVLAAVGSAVWTAAFRRTNDPAVYRWFRVFLRLAVGTELLLYGFVKAVPLQMPYPFLTRLLEPYGNFSPMGVLWASVGASPAYEMVVGTAEAIAGLLLLFPRTALLGALIGLVDMTQVFSLNMTYDVPVKLLSFHLILMLLVILAADAPRLVRFLFTSAGSGPATCQALFRSARAKRIARIAQIVYAVLMIGTLAYSDSKSWHQYGPGAPKSELYGIWNIDRMTVDGQAKPRLVTEKNGWRRIIFERPGFMSTQLMGDTVSGFTAKMDTKASIIGLTRNGSNGMLHYQRPDREHLILDGTIDGHATRFECSMLDRDKMMLVSRGFHWISERPFNR